MFLWIKESQIPQVKEFSALLYLRRYKSPGSLKTLLSCASQLSEASVLFFLGAHCKEWLCRRKEANSDSMLELFL